MSSTKRPEDNLADICQQLDESIVSEATHDVADRTSFLSGLLAVR